MGDSVVWWRRERQRTYNIRTLTLRVTTTVELKRRSEWIFFSTHAWSLACRRRRRLLFPGAGGKSSSNISISDDVDPFYAKNDDQFRVKMSPKCTSFSKSTGKCNFENDNFPKLNTWWFSLGNSWQRLITNPYSNWLASTVSSMLELGGF